MRMQQGFSLVEVMVVLLTVGILAALAYPHLASHVVKARRAQAQAALLALMQQQERYFSEHNTYIAFSADGSGAAGPGAMPFAWHSGTSAAASAYELSGEACPGQALASCIELRATPGTARVDATFRDSACEILTLDSEGGRGATGTDLACWP